MTDLIQSLTTSEVVCILAFRRLDGLLNVCGKSIAMGCMVRRVVGMGKEDGCSTLGI